MRKRWWLGAIWACFFVRLAFYATAFPLWEGFDEWAHFAVVRHMVANHQVLPSRDATLPLDVAASLQYAPMPPTLSNLPEGALSHEAFWALPAAERQAREESFRAIPHDFKWQPSRIAAYEALQPPLYYWLVTPPLWLARNCTLSTQVLLLRWLSIAIASFLIPLLFLVGRAVFGDDYLALGCAAVVALLPQLAVSMARCSNECLAVVLYTGVTLLVLRRGSWWVLGVVLGLGLITKAYFLAAVAGVVLAFWAPRSLALAALISGWWYIRNLITTGTLTGLSESVILRNVTPFGMLRGADTLPWAKAVDSILFSHLYFGGWSSLTVRSWMYHLIYVWIGLAGLGLIGLWRKSEIRSLGFIYAAFWLAQLYNTVLIYLSKGVPTSMGWYLYAVIGAQAVLATAGLRRIAGKWALGVSAVLFGLLDLYAMNAIALPYYTGMLARKSNGALAAAHFSQLRAGEVFERLTAFKPQYVTAPGMMALWGIYVGGTIALIGMAAWCGRRAKAGVA
jgi:hypothetical protein